MSNTFTKSQRIKSKKEIFSLFKSGKRWCGDLFTVTYRKNNSAFDRIAIIVSKKSGSAVRRNRIKRVFREVFRITESVNPPFFDILVYPHCSSSVSTEAIKERYVLWQKKQKA